ncbi:hypothetical protein N7492_005138 [Penicillium capsulatum]|uniref:Uncharacterized protein n=1 Tax=Penicillium capsulatum TaxID=69766 RepID=A0A9W9I923_9EURO|nr:hypothetical protein N7492_005138 [Penicillium capsulatum]
MTINMATWDFLTNMALITATTNVRGATGGTDTSESILTLMIYLDIVLFVFCVLSIFALLARIRKTTGGGYKWY